jgi:hypothetical protein
VFLFFPFVFVLDQLLKEANDYKKYISITVVFAISMYSVARVIHATGNYYGRIPKDFMYYLDQVPWFLWINLPLIIFVVIRVKSKYSDKLNVIE